MSEELKACPFCGGEYYLEVGLHHFNDVIIGCRVCGAQGGLHDEEGATVEDNKESAIAEWNTRTFTQEQVERVTEELKQWIVANLRVNGKPPLIFDKEYLSLTKAALEAVGVVK